MSSGFKAEVLGYCVKDQSHGLGFRIQGERFRV
jgi:hypothetical protein